MTLKAVFGAKTFIPLFELDKLQGVAVVVPQHHVLPIAIHAVFIAQRPRLQLVLNFILDVGLYVGLDLRLYEFASRQQRLGFAYLLSLQPFDLLLRVQSTVVVGQVLVAASYRVPPALAAVADIHIQVFHLQKRSDSQILAFLTGAQSSRPL